MVLSTKEKSLLNRMNPTARDVKLGDVIASAESSISTINSDVATVEKATAPVLTDLAVGQIAVDNTAKSAYIKVNDTTILSFTTNELVIP